MGDPGTDPPADITAAHYLAGTIGLSLIRNWYRDGEANDVRMQELSDLLENLDAFPNSLVLNPDERDLHTGYTEWADEYDGPNPLIEAEQTLVQPILASLAGERTTVLDAACGTGRHAAFLADLGCTVTGIDQSVAMLELARENVPAASFDEGSLTDLPYADDRFEIVVVSLALCHLADPAPAIRELGRVLAPGGTMVISDPHPMGGAVIGGQAFYGGIVPGRRMTWVRNHYHLASTWFDAFAAAGLDVRRCIEQPFTEGQIAATPALAFYPEAVRNALAGLVNLWVWVVGKPAA